MSATCSGCGQPIEGNNSGCGNVCRHCGAILQTSATTKTPIIDESLKPRRPLLQQKNRGLLWLAFWFLLLGAPFAPFINAAMSSAFHIRFRFINDATTLIGGIAGGALGGGFILAWLYSRTTLELVTQGVLFSISIVLFYAAVAYAGYLYLRSHAG